MTQPVWSVTNLANPHAVQDKADRVRSMFAAIARSYDLNNRVHSLGQDQAWRRAAVIAADLKRGDSVLDVACGTGDLTLAFACVIDEQRQPSSVQGVDFTPQMLEIAKEKTRCWPDSPRSPRLAATPSFCVGDAMALDLPDASVDVVSIAFGIRNVSDPAKAMREFHRVLRPGGRVIILEFSLPANPLLRGLYNFYFQNILPRTASLIAGDRSGAYSYLPQSVQTFISREQMQSMLQSTGFEKVEHQPLTFGIAVVYRGVKPG